MIFKHSTWAEALAYANVKAKLTGYRYRVHRAPVGWWLVSRGPRRVRGQGER